MPALRDDSQSIAEHGVCPELGDPRVIGPE
jgi:hypothetical protein